MAGDHIENQWKDELKVKFPQFFTGVKVLDVGSADINGTNKPWFDNCEYIGLDVRPYRNVDIVSIAHEYDAPNESFDVVSSTSELEHDMYWDKTLQKMVKLLKSGGFMWFSAGYRRPEHGTKYRSPDDSLTVRYNDQWALHYRNISEADVRRTIKVDDIFSQYEFSYSKDNDNLDLHFWGVKK